MVDTLEALDEDVPRPRKSYPLETRQQLIELARTGRSPESHAKEFEPAAKTIRDRVNQAERAGLGLAGESNKDRLIAQLRRESSVLLYWPSVNPTLGWWV